VTASRGKRADEIFEAAVKVFYERSYAGATVQDVADEVGILKGSLHHYIATKEDLLFWHPADLDLLPRSGFARVGACGLRAGGGPRP
jgi:hypothetical protein